MAHNDQPSRSTRSPQDSRQYELPWSHTTQAPTTPGDRHGRDEAKLPSGLGVAMTHAGQTDASPDPLPQGSEPPAVVSPVRNERRRPLNLRDRVERLLRDRGIPYVNVDEAKRALFASAKLRAFHFVAYANDGPNWLIFAARADRRVRETMAEWERVFGDGFIAVLATHAGGENAGIRFRSLDGRPLTLDPA